MPTVCTGESLADRASTDAAKQWSDRRFAGGFGPPPSCDPRPPDTGSWHGFSGRKARFGAEAGPITPQELAQFTPLHFICDCQACRRAASDSAAGRATSPRWLKHRHQQIGFRTP